MSEADVKRLSTARARCALLRHMPGTVLHAIEADNGRTVFIVTWQSLCRTFETLAEVDAWLSTVEVRG
jgi:hypothetical protein